jgi:hypothetical protein
LKEKLRIEKEKKTQKAQKRKVTPIKIKELIKKQKMEKPKTPKKSQPKKSSVKVQQQQPMEVTTSNANAPPSTSAYAANTLNPANQQVQPVGGQSQGENENEKMFDSSVIIEKKRGRDAPVFNDKNLDYNLFNNDPDNVVAKKIKISQNVIVQCSMVDGSEKGRNAAFQDYAALSFLRKTKDEKAFEFNLPLGLAPNIIEALKLIIQDNPKFFHKFNK